jgi:hypothetical protein
MNEIEGSLGQRITSDVVATHVHVRQLDLLQKPRLDVGRQNPAGWADSVAKPSRNRAASAADFQAVPSRGHAAVREMALTGRVEERRQGRESGSGVVCGIHVEALYSAALS